MTMKCMNYEVRSVFTAVEFLLQMYWRKCVNVPNACPFWSPMNEFDKYHTIDLKEIWIMNMFERLFE